MVQLSFPLGLVVYICFCTPPALHLTRVSETALKMGTTKHPVLYVCESLK